MPWVRRAEIQNKTNKSGSSVSQNKNRRFLLHNWLFCAERSEVPALRRGWLLDIRFFILIVARTKRPLGSFW